MIKVRFFLGFLMPLSFVLVSARTAGPDVIDPFSDDFSVVFLASLMGLMAGAVWQWSQIGPVRILLVGLFYLVGLALTTGGDGRSVTGVIVLTPVVGFFLACLAAVRIRRSAKQGYCAICGYCLTGLPEPRCPECGTPFDTPRSGSNSQPGRLGQ